MPIPTDEERLGTTLADRYKIDAILGKGGMGIVYAATHTWTGRDVAVKILKSDYAADASTVRRFLQEARTASTIHHPNVIDVLDMGSDDDGMVFLVMERLFGETLGARLKRDEHPMDAVETLEVMLPVLSALHAAHQAGVLHRDVKPENIFLSLDADARIVPKILDFGMAKLLEEAIAHHTQSGDILGTPCYMSPEQAEGAPTIGPQADVWSLGAVLYHCLAGVKPFDAPSMPAVLLQIARGRFKPLVSANPAVPAQVADVVERALSLDLAHRHASAAAFGRELRAAGRRSGVAFVTNAFQTEGETTIPTSAGPSKSRLALYLGAAMGVLALASVVSLLSVLVRDDDDPDRGTPGTAMAAGPETSEEYDGRPSGELERDAVVDPPREATLTAVLPPPQVVVETDPPGAEVRRGDTVLCNTPCAIDSSHASAVTLVRPGYRSHSLDIEREQEGSVQVALSRRERRASSQASNVPAMPPDPF